MTFDVAILGAGAAGVGAARRLAAAGRRVVVLEASSRVGGRAWTQEIDGTALDLGCGWLHSGDRNSWTRIAEETGFTVDRSQTAWRKQWRDIGFSAAERAAADQAYDAFHARLERLRDGSDRASDALAPGGEWNPWLQAISGYVNGAPLERVSATDFLAYERASTDANWRLPAGYGSLVAASMPPVALHLATPARGVALTGAGVRVDTARGTIEAGAAIVTLSSALLAAGALTLPPALDDQLAAAARLPLGLADKLFLAVVDRSAVEVDTHLLGDPRSALTASYSIMPLGKPVVECFLGGSGAEAIEREGAQAAYAFVLGELAALLGSGVRRALRPLAASAWRRSDWALGSYSHALPGCADARTVLARPFEDRIFFAGEATHATDFSTAHGAHDSGVRAADEVLAAAG